MNQIQQAVLNGDVDTVISVIQRLEEEERGTGRTNKVVDRPFNNETLLTPLHVACLAGDSKMVDALLGKNPDLIRTDAKGRLPLHCALESTDLDSVQLVLQALERHGWAGKVMSIRDTRDLTPLHLGCTRPDILKALLSQNFSKDRIWCSDGLLRRILQSKQAFESLTVLQKVSPIPPHLLGEVDSNGKTPLIEACESGCLEAAKLLLSLGADPETCDVDGQNVLHWACFLGHEEIKQWLVNLPCAEKLCSKQDREGKVPFDYLCEDVDEEEECEGNAEVEDENLNDSSGGSDAIHVDATLQAHELHVEELIQESHRLFDESPETVHSFGTHSDPPIPPTRYHKSVPGQVHWKKDRYDLENAIAEETRALEQLHSHLS